MSTATPTPGYGPLEVFFDAEEGVSLQADDGEFLCPIEKAGFPCIGMKTNKDQSCKFLVEELSNGKVRIKDSRGFYLKRNYKDGWSAIEVKQMTPDQYCEFLVFYRDGYVLFKADNGLFMSRVDGGFYSGVNTWLAAKPDADQFCNFALDVGDINKPAFEIAKINTRDSFSLDKKRVTVRENEFVNKSYLAENYTFKLTWEKRFAEVTTWNRGWGLNTTSSAEVCCFHSHHHGVTLWYDGVHGKSASRERTISLAEEVTVTVPPGRTMTAKLVVIMDENAEIPFAATIKKTKADGRIEMLTECGTWKGVVYDGAFVEISIACM